MVVSAEALSDAVSMVLVWTSDPLWAGFLTLSGLPLLYFLLLVLFPLLDALCFGFWLLEEVLTC